MNNKIVLIQEDESQQLEEIQTKLDRILNHLNTEQVKPLWLTVKQFADKENISIGMVYKLIAQDKIQTRKIGRKTQVKSWDK